MAGLSVFVLILATVDIYGEVKREPLVAVRKHIQPAHEAIHAHIEDVLAEILAISADRLPQGVFDIDAQVGYAYPSTLDWATRIDCDIAIDPGVFSVNPKSSHEPLGRTKMVTCVSTFVDKPTRAGELGYCC